MISLEAFSELLEVLYSAPLQQEQWPRFLTLLSKHTQSQLSAFLCAGSRLGLSIHAQGGSTPSDRLDVTAYNERYAQKDPFRAPALRDSRPRIAQDEDLLPNAGLLQTELYRNILFPQGARYGTLILLTITMRRLECVTIWRSHDQGPMDEDCNRLLHLLFPHIQKALEIRQVLGIAQQHLAGAEAMVDASSAAIFLLTREGRVLHQNTAAGSLLRESDALSLQEGILIAAEPQSRISLRNLFLNATLPFSLEAETKPAHALLLHRPSGKRALQLLASPLPLVHRNRCSADLILLVTDPGKPLNFPDDVFRALYGLTPAETEVANGLLTGYSLDELASLRRVSVGTARQQLKSILSKTGTNRQSDLIRLLMTIPSAASAN